MINISELTFYVYHSHIPVATRSSNLVYSTNDGLDSKLQLLLDMRPPHDFEISSLESESNNR